MNLKEEVRQIRLKATERMFEKERLKEDISKTVRQIEEYMNGKYLEKIAIEHFGKNSLYCSKNLVENGVFEMRNSNIILNNDSILNEKISNLKTCIEDLNDKKKDATYYTEYLELGIGEKQYILGKSYLKEKLVPYLCDAGFNARVRDEQWIEVKITLLKNDAKK